jgi:hypothetical protein
MRARRPESRLSSMWIRWTSSERPVVDGWYDVCCISHPFAHQARTPSNPKERHTEWTSLPIRTPS